MFIIGSVIGLKTRLVDFGEQFPRCVVSIVVPMDLRDVLSFVFDALGTFHPGPSVIVHVDAAIWFTTAVFMAFLQYHC